MKIGVKLTVTFFSIAFLSVIVIGYISYNKGKKSLKQESFNRLTAVREMKATQIEDYFKLIQDQAGSFSHDPTVIEAMKSFKKGFDNTVIDGDFEEKKGKLSNYVYAEFLPKLNHNIEKAVDLKTELCSSEKGIVLQYQYIVNNPMPAGKKQELLDAKDASEYTNAHKKYHPFFKEFLEKFGYYDIFLIDSDNGNVVYTVFKELDFATNLHNGPFKTTNLADAFRQTTYSTKSDDVQLVDFKPYHPSYNSHASFIAVPIIENGKKIGVLAFQMPIDHINDIMTSKHQWQNVGLGKSGETYIVGEDFTLRSQSRFFLEDSVGYYNLMRSINVPEATVSKMRTFKSTIGLQNINTEGTKAALNGETSAKIFNDYRNLAVLSSYKPLNIKGMKWVIMSEIDEAEAFEQVFELRNQVLIFASILAVLIFGISLFVSKQITKPIKELTHDARQLQKGNFDVKITIDRKDEIGVLATSFKKMQHSMKKLIVELKEINHNLEEKVAERTQDLQLQKEMVEHKNKEIVDSIKYAKRLQQAILPPLQVVEENLPSSFILYKPKDIIAGDFYWMEKVSEPDGSERILFAAADCTGHGVPGAMVSVVGANGLERCVKEFMLHKPAEILDKLTDLVIKTFDTFEEEVKDGMDIALVSIDRENKILQYAGANNPLWVVRQDIEGLELIEVKADKQPIGKFDYRKPFTNHTIQLKEGDCIYLFTDGYADQFGGPQGKKFKYKTLKDLLMSLYHSNMKMQEIKINEAFEEWKSEYDQVDDVCIIGFRV